MSDGMRGLCVSLAYLGVPLKTLISILVLLLALPCFAQEEKLEIRDFKGLNTAASDFSIKPNEGRRVANIDFSRNIGALTKRYGYECVDTLSGFDSVLTGGMYSAYYRDGRQRLLIAADFADSGFGALYATNVGSVNISNDSLTEIFQPWSTMGSPSFAMEGDNVYIVNGYNRGVVWNGGVAQPFPMKAPGEPTIVPIEHASGELNGEYRYVFEYRLCEGAKTCFLQSKSAFGYVSAPIRVDNGRVLLTDFAWPGSDSVRSAPDSAEVWIYRTKANPGPLTATTGCGPLYYTEEYVIAGASTPAALADLVVIDSVSDIYITESDVAVERQYAGRDSTGALTYRLGAPTYYGSKHVATGSGMFTGIPKQADTLGVAYACTFIDTVTAIESDTGRSMFVFCNPDSLLDSVAVGLPRVPDGATGIKINLYRALIRQITYDDSTLGSMSAITRFSQIIAPNWVSFLAVDEVVCNEYFLIAQLSASDTIFHDTLTYDSVSTRRQFHKSTPPALLDQIFTYNGRLYGVEGSRLWRSGLLNSAVDTLQRWGQMDFQALNEDDGDAGTIAFPTRTAIRFMKNSSNYNVYDDFGKREISGHWGCIAPKSHSAGINGHYYLTGSGVVRESEGGELERTVNLSLISEKVKAFSRLSSASAYHAYSPPIYNNKYMLTMGDTTLVYDEITGDWNVWSLPFGAACLYGAESIVGFRPADTLYFFKPGDSVLCRYGTSEFDAYTAGVDSTNIGIRWYSGPLFAGDYHKEINSIGRWVTSTDADFAFDVRIRDDEGASDGVVSLDSLTYRHRVFKAANNYGMYFTLELTCNFTAGVSVNTVLDGLDIYYMRKERFKVY